MATLTRKDLAEMIYATTSLGVEQEDEVHAAACRIQDAIARRDEGLQQTVDEAIDYLSSCSVDTTSAHQ